MAPGPVRTPLFELSQPTWSLPPEKQPRQECLTGAHADFWPAAGPVIIRSQLRRGCNEGESAETATSLNFCAGVGLRRSRMKTATGHIREARVPGRHLVRLFRACSCFSLRVGISAQQLTELVWLPRPIVRFLRCLWCLPGAMGSIPAERKHRRLCPNSMIAQSFRHH